MALKKSLDTKCLSAEERTNLVELVREKYGDTLTRIDFVDVILGLFEDIPGFEAISPSAAKYLVHQLWSTYHGKESREA